MLCVRPCHAAAKLATCSRELPVVQSSDISSTTPTIRWSRHLSKTPAPPLLPVRSEGRKRALRIGWGDVRPPEASGAQHQTSSGQSLERESSSAERSCVAAERELLFLIFAAPIKLPRIAPPLPREAKHSRATVCVPERAIEAAVGYIASERSQPCYLFCPRTKSEQISKEISGCQDPVKILRCCPSATLAKFCRGSTPG